MVRVIPLLAFLMAPLAGCASTTSASNGVGDAGDVRDAADLSSEAGCSDDVFVSPEDAAAVCDPAREFYFDCQGGGGCSEPAACHPFPAACAGGCGRCACAMRAVHCNYPVSCVLRGGVLLVPCPPD